MLKEYKHYSVSVDIIDRRGKLFKVRAVINSKSTFNLIHPLLITEGNSLIKSIKRLFPFGMEKEACISIITVKSLITCHF